MQKKFTKIIKIKNIKKINEKIHKCLLFLLLNTYKIEKKLNLVLNLITF